VQHRRSIRVPSIRVPSIRVRSAVLAFAVAIMGVVTGIGASPANAATNYWVAPSGLDTNPGTDAAPFKTLQKALDVATAGTTINLKPGEYHQAVATKTAGTATAPITIKGPETGKDVTGRYKAVLYGLGGRVFSINHSYYTLSGFTIDGQQNIARTAYPAVSSLSQIRTFKDSVQDRAVNSKLVYVGASTTLFDIVGTTISDMFLNGSGGECVRFRDRAANSLIDNSTIQWCGMLGQGNDVDQYKYHNAEGVYVGTSPKSTDQPLYANDTSNNIVVRNSTINTYGSECFEVKENAHHNRMENSKCGWNDEPSTFQGSNVEFRGDHNTVLGSTLSNSRSWNMKLASDSSTYDKGGNTAQGTSFSGAATYGIINRQTGSGPFCGDTFTGPVSDPSGNSVGTPTATCAGSAAPTVTARTPAINATSVAATTNVTATFSEAVQGVTGTTFTLKAGTTNVAATVNYDAASRTATLDPSADLAANTQYTATLTGGASAIKGATGTPLATVSWTFTTAAPVAPVDTTPPTVTAQAPAANATGVAVGSNVTATFSEAVSGVTGSTFTLKPGTATSTAANVSAVVTYNATTRVATLDPTANLALNTSYTATLTGGASAIRDAANNPLATVSWTFTTAAAPADTSAPTVTARNPGSNATGSSRTANITATFSEPVTGVSGSTFTLKNTSTGATITALVSYNATTRVATLNPNTTLASSTKFTVTLTGGAAAIRDAAGNPLTTTTWSFTTGRF
jgi:methionine-rich copper-binding protein CopC